MTAEPRSESHDDDLDRRHRRHDPDAWTATSTSGVVASAHYLASQAGADILAAGGNAFDAAIATSLALGVCEPAGSGLGGMALMVVHHQGRTFTVEGPCRAPASADPAVVARHGRYRGHRAVALPGAMRVVQHIHERHARLGFAELVAPAWRLATGGVAVTPLQHELMRSYRRVLDHPSLGDLFLVQGAPRPVGSQLVQPELAATLAHLAEAGPGAFYEGPVATEIADDHARNGGFLSVEDLAATPPAREADPVTARLGPVAVSTVGPPGGGLWLAQMAALVTATLHDTPVTDLGDPAGVAALARVISAVRRERRRHRLDVGAEDTAAAARLLSPDAVGAVVASLPGVPGRGPVPVDGSTGETSHFCVVDDAGTVVSCTQSIERSFGAGCRSPRLGFLYNGFLRAFKVQNRRHPNYLRPGIAARSNAAPTIVSRDGRPWVAVGSTGSERAASSILEVLVRLGGGAEPFAAVAAPRFHASPDGGVAGELGRLPAGTAEVLRAEGWEVRDVGDWAFAMGGLQLAVAGPPAVGVAEPRRDGGARAPR